MGVTGAIFGVGGTGSENFQSHSPQGVVELPIPAPSGRGEWSFSASAVLWLGWRTAATRCGRQGSPSARGEPLPAPWVPGGCCHPGAAWGTARRSRSKPPTLCANNEVLNQANKTLQFVLSSYHDKYTLLMTRRTAFELSTITLAGAVLGGCRSPARPGPLSPPSVSLALREGPGARTCAGPAGATPGARVRPRGRAGGGARRARAGRGCAGSASSPSWRARCLRATLWRGRPQCTPLLEGRLPALPASGEVSPSAPPFWRGGSRCAPFLEGPAWVRLRWRGVASTRETCSPRTWPWAALPGRTRRDTSPGTRGRSRWPALPGWVGSLPLPPVCRGRGTCRGAPLPPATGPGDGRRRPGPRVTLSFPPLTAVLNGKRSPRASQASGLSNAERPRPVRLFSGHCWIVEARSDLARGQAPEWPPRGPRTSGRAETARVHARALLTALAAGPYRLQGRPPGARGSARTEELAGAGPRIERASCCVRALGEEPEAGNFPGGRPAHLCTCRLAALPAFRFRPGPDRGPHFPAQDTEAPVPRESGLGPRAWLGALLTPAAPVASRPFGAPPGIWALGGRCGPGGGVWGAAGRAPRDLRPARSLGGPGVVRIPRPGVCGSARGDACDPSSPRCLAASGEQHPAPSSRLRASRSSPG